MIANQVFINVRDCRCVVSRYEHDEQGWLLRAASNAADLEQAAQSAVQEQGGAYYLASHYNCPNILATQAVFESR